MEIISSPICFKFDSIFAQLEIVQLGIAQIGIAHLGRHHFEHIHWGNFMNTIQMSQGNVNDFGFIDIFLSKIALCRKLVKR